jgi:phosphoribosylformylglycinamidine (FGAM) synthase-like enzyme
MREDTLLFSESQGRILLSVYPEGEKRLLDLAGDVPLFRIGETTDNGMITFRQRDDREQSIPVKECLDIYTAWSRSQGGGY